MVYFDHAFYRLLTRSYRVHIHPDALVIVNRDGGEERRASYSQMSREELAAVCHYVGQLAERLRREL